MLTTIVTVHGLWLSTVLNGGARHLTLGDYVKLFL